MKDKDFLKWIHERLVSLGDDPLVDYLHKLRAVIHATPPQQNTPNTLCCNNLKELEELEKRESC